MVNDVATGRGAEDKPIAESTDFKEFKRCIYKKTSIDLNLYKTQQMHRRLYNMVERAGASTFMEYFRIIERDTSEYAAFMDRLTINVSELFRNPEKWDELKTKVLPPVLKSKRELKVWSAGCSYGAEPYSLAILLEGMTPGQKHTIHATDLDRNILAKAQKGIFLEADVKNVPIEAIGKHFSRSAAPGLIGGAAYEVSPEIKRKVQFRQQNLLADKFESGYDLICCRNVVIYFTDPAKDELFARFFDALSPGGTLFVGGTERIFNFRELGFESSLPFFYQKKK